MRKLLSYLILCLTTFLIIGFCFNPVVKNTKTDAYYGNTYTYTYQLFQQDQDGGGRLTEDTQDNKNAVENFITLSENRLKKWGVSNYSVEKEDEGLVNISFSAQNDYEYKYISNLLCCTGDITIFTTDAEAEYFVSGSDMFNFGDSEAYINYTDNSNDVVIPLTQPDKFKTILEHAKELEKAGTDKEDDDKDKDEDTDKKDDSEEEEDPLRATKNCLVVALNWQEGDDYAKVKKDVDGVAKKILFRLSATDQESNVNDKKYLKYSVLTDGSNLKYGPSKSSDDSTSTTANSETTTKCVYMESVYFCNLLNTTNENRNLKFDYKVINTYKQLNLAKSEDLISHNFYSYAAVSKNLKATLIAMAVAVLLLAFFFGIMTVGVAAASLGSTFLTYTAFSLLGATFTAGTMVGLIVVFLMSVFTWALFYHYFKNEVYRGRNLKKSTQEASKRTTLPTVDISILSLILGLFTFYLGGTILHALGTVLIFGSFVNILINLVFSKILFILVTNDNYVMKHLKLLNIKSELIPSILEGEKGTKYEPAFAKKDFVKHKKPAMITFGSLVLIAVIGLITFSAIPNMKLFNSNETTTQQKLHITITDESSGIKSIELLQSEALNNIYVNDKDHKLDYSTSISEKTRTVWDNEEEMNVTYTYFIVPLNKAYSTSDSIFFTNEISEKMTLQEALTSVFMPYIDEDKGEYFTLSNVEQRTSDIDVGMVFVVTYSTLAIMTVYFLFRYRPSKALTYFVSTGLSILPVVGITALTRIPCGDIITISAIAVFAISSLISLFVMAKSKDMYKNEKVVGVDNLYKQYNEATLFSLEDNTIVVYTALLVLLVFGAFGSTFSNSIFLGSAIGCAIYFFVMLMINPFLYKLFVKLFSQVSLPQLKLPKKTTKVKEKSNEPEEAIFVGIND